jgi:hypothetical protein
MKANKRVRDLNRRSYRRLYAVGRDGVPRGTTTYPTLKNKVQSETARSIR